MTVDVVWVWWRRVQLGEFFNIERSPTLPTGAGGGARYIEIPTTLVPATQRFLGQRETIGEPRESTISVMTIGAPELVLDLEFKRKAGGRLRIANQNRQATPEKRHPAWKAERGFPKAPDDIETRQDAAPYYPDGGLRIFIAKTRGGLYYAGFTKGRAPSTLPARSVTRLLYQDGPGGLITEFDDVL